MTFWEAVLLGVVQGIFMFFPVSSTSHLVLLQHWLIDRGSPLPSPDSPEMILFDLVVHVGTLVSMAVVFRRSIASYFRRLWGAVRKASPEAWSSREWLAVRLLGLGAISVAVTGLVGFPLRAAFAQVFAQPAAIGGTLIVTGVLLWWTDVLSPRRVGLQRLGLMVALVVGLAQALALLPGISRSGATIAFALFLGLRRRWAAEFSFFIAFPTILGASLLQAMEVAGGDGLGGLGATPLMVGFGVAALVGVGALYVVLHLLYRARFRFFSYYVWCLAAVVFALSWGGDWMPGPP